jgi:hemoglobin-like flavoprotein
MIQDQLIRDSFAVIHEMPEAVAMLFYGRLFTVDPSLRPLFKIDMHTQSKKLMDTLASVVDSLDHLDRMRPALRELGRKHAVEYGVRPQHYPIVVEALLWALGQALQPHFYADTKEAWQNVLQDIAREMLSGAEAAGQQ